MIKKFGLLCLILLTMNVPARTEEVLCREIPLFDSSDWKQIKRAFASAPVWKFSQPWRERPERGFRSGKVRIGWQGDRLLYFADLSDKHVITFARKRNDRMWMLGDVLEIFAGVHEQPGYIEYHTTPNSLVLQLYWPDAEALHRTERGMTLKSFMVNDESAVAKARITRGGWQVYGEIPVASVQKSKRYKNSLAGQTWDLSFGRYDYAPDGKSFLLSSTSPLTKGAYHRRQEWRSVTFSKD